MCGLLLLRVLLLLPMSESAWCWNCVWVGLIRFVFWAMDASMACDALIRIASCMYGCVYEWIMACKDLILIASCMYGCVHEWSMACDALIHIASCMYGCVYVWTYEHMYGLQGFDTYCFLYVWMRV